MAGQALLGPQAQVFCVIHAQGDRFLMVRVAGCMRPKPLRRRTMAAFTAHAIVDVEFASLLLVAWIQSMADKTLRCMRGIWGAQTGRTEDLRNALRNGVIKDAPGLRVLVLQHPRAVLVLKDFSLLSGLHRSMTGCGAARSRADVAGFRGRNLLQKDRLIGRFQRQRQQENQHKSESSSSSGTKLSAAAQPSVHCAFPHLGVGDLRGVPLYAGKL